MWHNWGTKMFLNNSTKATSGPGSSVGIATGLRAGRSGIESRWGRDFPPVQIGPGAHPVSCKMGTGSFPLGKVRPGRAADHSPPSSAAVMEEYSYTSTHYLGHTGPVTGSLYLYLTERDRFGVWEALGRNCLVWENNFWVWVGPHTLLPHIFESNPHPFYSFRGLKNQMRIRIACGLDSRSWAEFWKKR